MAGTGGTGRAGYAADRARRIAVRAAGPLGDGEDRLRRISAGAARHDAAGSAEGQLSADPRSLPADPRLHPRRAAAAVDPGSLDRRAVLGRRTTAPGTGDTGRQRRRADPAAGDGGAVPLLHALQRAGHHTGRTALTSKSRAVD